MPFTFECGVCHAVYRLDENQITAGGVKITCPRCLNFFFLKRGGTADVETPVVEHIVADGAYDVSKKPIEAQIPKQPIKESVKPHPLREQDLFDSADKIKPTKAGLTIKSTTHVKKYDLIDLPADLPRPTGFDRIFWPITFLGLGILAVLALGIRGIIHIPGLGENATKFINPTEINSPPPETNEKRGKHGFPQINPGYDPWTGKPKPSEESNKN